MRTVVIIALVSMFATSAFAHDRAKIQALEARVAALEQRVAILEGSPGGQAAAPARNAETIANEQRSKARKRMRKDREIYSRQQLSEIERLYQVANKEWQTQEARDSLKKMIDKYDKANRTGCALLYLGQMTQGQERENYLKQAIEGFSDCYYGDGVQVGAYARYYLAGYYRDIGNTQEERRLLDEIRTQYPDAINHRGRLLSDLLDEW